MSDTPTAAPPSFVPNWLFALLTHATSLSALLGAFDTHSSTANAAIKIGALVAQLAVTVGIAHAHGGLLQALEHAKSWLGPVNPDETSTLEQRVEAALDRVVPEHLRTLVEQTVAEVQSALPQQMPTKVPGTAPFPADAARVPVTPDPAQTFSGGGVTYPSSNVASSTPGVAVTGYTGANPLIPNTGATGS